MHAARGVGRTRPGADEADGGPPRDAAIGGGGEGDAALVPRRDQPDPVLRLLERRQHRHVALARHRERGIHAPAHQRLHQPLATLPPTRAPAPPRPRATLDAPARARPRPTDPPPHPPPPNPVVSGQHFYYPAILR